MGIEDPMSHRIIEKRRRDRMNNCLSNLSKLIPPAYLKKGRGRVEKTEIIEMGIRYLKHLQDERKSALPGVCGRTGTVRDMAVGPDTTSDTNPTTHKPDPGRVWEERYKQGFHDCIAETLRYFAGAEGQIISQDSKARLLVHLNDYFGRLGGGSSGASPRDEPLNMSLKRPRLEDTKRPPVFRFQPAEGQLVGEGEEGKGSGSGAWSSQYPSSPGSSRSFSDVSSGGSFPDSPPRVLSPPHSAHHHPQEGSGTVPIFALHTSGLFYVPLSVPQGSMGPAGMGQLSSPAHPPPASCHPVTITVHFNHTHSVRPLLLILHMYSF